jgi:hypothetical protein
MFKIDPAPYGFKLTFGGFIQLAEMKQWVQEAGKQLANQRGPFGVVVDMRTLSPLPKDAQLVMETGQKQFKMKGMQRSAVVLQNAITTVQFKRIAQESGIYQWERYFDASKVLDWERRAIDWVRNSVDPDKAAT